MWPRHRRMTTGYEAIPAKTARSKSGRFHTQIAPQTPVLLAFLPSLTITIPPDPPETVISRVFLGIAFSMRTVLTRVKSPWRYVHTYTWKIAR